ncbi:Crp/Fnr family transcriptional regulator [Microvirga lotononidis]|uniref:cAMP-binding protein n=1 Tax=Microvirga lotononidis TaxID=864069 RepID=I4YWV1_9HYPH|nr:Crp/Fnr family transcriptional regulator [Microvirga lotononidis]EIM28443.1 cAMP-binding protein [Microvirga lotononidis]WQO27478.1 Crp/Fnr family transcriptional regulator [Microvirga lotononidis]
MAQVQMDNPHCGNRLLAALDDEDFAYLEPHLTLVDLHRGQVVYEAGQRLDYTYFPHTAVISLVTVMLDGKSAEMATFGCESIVGLVSAFISRDSFGRYIVQIGGTASRVDLDRMHDAFRTRPKVQQLLLRFTEALLAQTLQSVACNATHSVEARCCRWILNTRDRWASDDIPLTHEFLSEMLGVQRSSVSAVTRALHEAGLINQSRGVITIIDRSGLEEMACECYEIIRRKFSQLLPPTNP